MIEVTPLFDTHCHIDLILEKGMAFEDLENGLIENHVSHVVQIASDPAAMEFSVKFCPEKSGKIQYYYTFGLHPNEAHELDTNSGINYIHQYSSEARFVAVGEVGLDYYYGLDHRNLQLKTFELYLEAALQYKKPVIIHTRNAHEDTVTLLKKYSDKIPVLIHCFTGNKTQVKDYLDLGAFISFSGIVTFKNAQDVRDAAIYCPVEQMVVETDAPFLAPVPNRGQINQPAWVKYVAEFMSSLKGRDISRDLYENSRKVFNLAGV